MDTDKLSPAHLTSNIAVQQDELQLLRDIQAGFPTYKSLLIPRLNESSQTYEARMKMPVLFDAITPAVDGHVGRMLKNGYVITELEVFGDLFDNIDGTGTALTPHLNIQISDSTWAGHSFILVEHPTMVDARSHADELDANARPYWIHIQKDAIRNLQSAVINGQRKITQITIAEQHSTAEGFGNKSVAQYRVLRLSDGVATWQLYRDADGKPVSVTAEVPFIDGNGLPFDIIPLVPLYTNQTGFLQSRPYFIELARLVQYKYNIATDKDHNMAMSSYPTLVGKGIRKEDLERIEMAGSKGIALPNIDQELSYIAGPGKGVELAQSIEAGIQRDMLIAGVRNFETDRPDRETAKAKILDSEIDSNDVRQVAFSMESALTTALQLTQRYINGESTATFRFVSTQAPKPDRETAKPDAMEVGDELKESAEDKVF